MAYIGVSPSNGVRRVHTYTATASQTTFSGAGAEGTTLSYKDSNFVDVYQNGVKLGDADYTATSGTSIVLGTGATASDLVVIVVFDVFSVADTVSKADGGTFDGNVTMGGTLTVTGNVISPVTIGGTTPTLTIGDAGAEDTKIVFDGNAQDFHVGLDDSNDSLTIGLGSALGTTSHIVIDANGHVTKPLNPMFNASEASTRQNMGINSTIAMNFDQITDVNGDYADDPGTFTAPVTGKYLLTVTLVMLQVDTDYSSVEVVINTSNRDYSNVIGPAVFDQDATYWSMTTTAVADMDANDTAKINFISAGGAEQLDISASSHYSGCLIG